MVLRSISKGSNGCGGQCQVHQEAKEGMDRSASSGKSGTLSENTVIGNVVRGPSEAFRLAEMCGDSKLSR